MRKFEVNGKRLIIEGIKDPVLFPYPIDCVEQIYGFFIVLLSPPTGLILNENVFGVNEYGKIVWTVEERGYVYPNSPYTNIGVKSNQLTLYNWDCINVIVDPYSGKILQKEFGK